MTKKKILIITSQGEKTMGWQERESMIQTFCKNLQEQLGNVLVHYSTFDDMRYSVIDGQTSIMDSRHRLNIKDYDLVQFKNWMYELEEAGVIADYLHRANKLFFNSEVNAKLAIGKLAQMFFLANAGVRVPDTFYMRNRALRETFAKEELPEGLTMPFIMKDTDGSRGDDNHLIKSYAQAQEILENAAPNQQFVLQNFIPNDGDYRLLFIGLDEDPMVFMRKGAGNTHLNNTSKGGSGTLLTRKQVPDEFISMAIKAAEVLGREIGGVDILVDMTNNTPYILEVNSTPAIASGYMTEKKVEKFASFVDRALSAQEDE